MFRSLLSNASSILLALFFAIVVWIVATSEQNPIREGLFPDAIPITFANRGEGLTLLEPSRLAARARIRTETSRWDTLNSGDFQLVADLGGLESGEYTVELHAVSDDPSTRVIAVDPPTVQVRLEKIQDTEMPVRVRLLDEPSLGYETKTPVVTPEVVTISGPQSDLDKVSDATVDIALRSEKAPIDRQATVVLHDGQGNLIQNLKVTPSSVQVHIPIEQRVGYKDAAVKAVINGNVASGYWVSDISVDPSTVTLIGAPEALDQLGGFVETEGLDVSGAKESLTKRVRLKLPEGVSVLNANDVNLKVSVEPVLSGLTVRRQVNLSESCNLPSKISPDTVDVILSGPLPTLQTLKPDDVQIVIDAPQCQPGSYQSELRAANVPDTIKVESIVPATAELNVQGGTPTRASP